LLHHVVEDGGRDADRRLRAVPPLGGARGQLALLVPQEDDAAVRADELEDARQDLLEQLVGVALGRDLARELVREAEALVVGAELVVVAGEPLEREEALVDRGDLRADGARLVVEIDPRALVEVRVAAGRRRLRERHRPRPARALALVEGARRCDRRRPGGTRRVRLVRRTGWRRWWRRRRGRRAGRLGVPRAGLRRLVLRLRERRRLVRRGDGALGPGARRLHRC